MTAPNRRKLWEHQDYQCPILGTCLSMTELKKLARKLGVTVKPGASDYELHAFFVGECRRESPLSSFVNKLLDKKFRKALRHFAKAADETSLEAMWRHAVKSGDIPGPFWALMSHPAAGDALLNKAFGEIHMLSHLMGAANRADIKRLAGLERRVEELTLALSKVQEARRAVKLEFTLKIKDLEDRLGTERAERLKLDRRLREAALRPGLFHREAASGPESLAVAGPDGARKIASGPEGARLAAHGGPGAAASPMLCLPGEALAARQLESAREQVRRQAAMMEELYRENARLRETVSDLRADLELAESGFVRTATGPARDTKGRRCTGLAPSYNGSVLSACPASPDGSCPCPLSGKCVLYVGGRCNLVRHYREMVESLGGTFIHHDGGVENSASELHGKLAGADMVLCPVDCVSHDACLAVKKACKARMKPFHMLRGSGLTSLARSLGSLAASCAN